MNRVPEALIQQQVDLRPYTTLRAGGPAEQFVTVWSADQLCETIADAQVAKVRHTVIGGGSNVLPSDDGVPGRIVLNRARSVTPQPDGSLIVDTGIWLQDLFLYAAQAGLRGLEFAVGIPGTLGGALVSNAGAYRASISDFLTGLEIVRDGRRFWTAPDYLEFSYRDSILRRRDAPQAAVSRVSMKLEPGDPKRIYDEARDYQRQRIGKQPSMASAGSFFKNVNDRELAERLPSLPASLRQAGVVPAGYLIEACGLKGFRHGGAMVGLRHANFLLNVRQATAFEIRDLAQYVRQRVYAEFGVHLEEEVLYLGDWSRWQPQ